MMPSKPTVSKVKPRASSAIPSHKVTNLKKKKPQAS